MAVTDSAMDFSAQKGRCFDGFGGGFLVLCFPKEEDGFCDGF